MNFRAARTYGSLPKSRELLVRGFANISRLDLFARRERLIRVHIAWVCLRVSECSLRESSSPVNAYDCFCLHCPRLRWCDIRRLASDFKFQDRGKGKGNFEVPNSHFPELFRARSRLYRSQILQVNTRWKALVEIYTMHSFAPFSNLKIFVKNRWKFC